ncbi:MAG: hypothetical protein A2219_01855 [Elusimicrobia bacterium RIFOXYA2_FULL_50_26]|nr:MAG: hypothetical protein A2219_01855 [Elusimicrobia bacterium RIFOXYA2_FULL_50_26]
MKMPGLKFSAAAMPAENLSAPDITIAPGTLRAINAGSSPASKGVAMMFFPSLTTSGFLARFFLR